MTKHIVYLVYATQLGNSKAIAEDLYDELSKACLPWSSSLICVSELEKSILLQDIKCMVLIGATTGDGDPPDTAKKFWRILHQSCKISDGGKNQDLDHLYYTILGLGDTNYTTFCNFGKTIDQKLQILKANRFYECGWADDGTGLELVVEPWTEGLLPALKKHITTHHNYQSSNIEKMVYTNENVCNTPDIGEASVLNSISASSILNSDNFTSGVSQIREYHIPKTTTLDFISENDISNHPVRKCAFDFDSKLTVPSLIQSYINISYTDKEKNLNDYKQVQNGFSLPSAASELVTAEIWSCKTLTNNGSLKKTLEVTLKLEQQETCKDIYQYEPGDSFAVISQNFKGEVDCLLDLLDVVNIADYEFDLTIDTNTKKKNPSIPGYIPVKCTLKYVFTYCIDIRTVPKKTFLRALCESTTDPLELRRMQELVSREGSSEYNDQIRSAGMTLLDILILFKSCKPPVSLIFEHCSRLIPRPYSITSSPLIEPNVFSFAFNIIEFMKGNGVTFKRRGICTGRLDDNAHKRTIIFADNLDSHLQSLTLEENYLQVYFRNNQSFRLPQKLTVPIIMVGPGTGVAPFLGFLEHRKLNVKLNNEELGESWLFFGCRNEHLDYIYKQELQDYLDCGALSNLNVCFSRDEDTASEKYVQDSLKKYVNEIAELLIDKNAIIYVCGDATNMAKDVFDAFVSIIQNYKIISNIDARKFVADLQIKRRYLQDVWT